MTFLVAHPMDDLPLQMVLLGQLISGQPQRKTLYVHQIQFLYKAWHEKLHTYDVKNTSLQHEKDTAGKVAIGLIVVRANI
jgi:hypothetical protein